MKSYIAKFQIGKQSITQGVVESLSLALKNHKQVRISVLKSLGRDREKMQEIIKELEEKLPFKCNFRVIGFTIIMNKISRKT